MPFNPKKKYTITTRPIQILEFYRYSDEYITRPPYQRKSVWSKRKKQDLLDSLFRRYYIPKIVIREVRLSEDKTVREIIDGQQRIITVQEFYNNQLKIPESLTDLNEYIVGKTYVELDSEIRRFIDRELVYDADIIEGIEDPYDTEHQWISTEIFWRLQQGEDLNFIEKAHARLSSTIRNFVVKFSDDITFDFDKYEPVDTNPNKHRFFKIISRKNDRMQHLSLLTRMTMLEENHGPTDLKDMSVIDYIERYMIDDGVGNDSFENTSFAKNVISNLNLFYEIFKDDPMIDSSSGIRELNTEYIILSTYLLVRHLKRHYVFDESEKKIFYDFFLHFYKRWSKKAEDDNAIQVFSNRRQQSVADVESRHMIMRQLFFEFARSKNHDILTKDDRRAFSESEKIAIYRRDGGLCQMCLDEGKPEKEAQVSWSEFEADHILPHSKGGNTIIENGQVLCRYHNRQKTNKFL